MYSFVFGFFIICPIGIAINMVFFPCELSSLMLFRWDNTIPQILSALFLWPSLIIGIYFWWEFI